MKNKIKAPVEKNETITLEITALNSEGQGIGRYEGFTVFVPYALPSEEVSAHVIKVNKNHAIAKLKEIHTKSEHRIEPACSHFYECGGCDLQHIEYSEQLRFKTKRVFVAITRIGGFEAGTFDMKDTIGSVPNTRYRNKASFPFANADGKVIAGLFAARSHRLIPIKDCTIQNSLALDAMNATCDFANKQGISAYDEQTHSGILRHLVVRTTQSGDVLVIIVTNGPLPYETEFIEYMKKSLPSLVGIVHNINNEKTNVIMGERFKTLHGEISIEESICGLKFKVAVQSFLQVNHSQTEKLYSLVIDGLKLSGNELVFDLYCGIGTISLLLAQHAKKVIGIESVNEAVLDARRNAQSNLLTNAEFISTEAETALPRLAKEQIMPDVIVIDPPRKGCDESVINAIIDCQPTKIAYISCNPETLARDLKVLAGGGYTVDSVQPVDMFPGTEHVETVVLITRVEK